MRWLIFISLIATRLALAAEADWRTPLAAMPIATNVTVLARTNCVDVMLRAFQSNGVVKALIFMPGATDEFYLFHRAQASLTNSNPSLLDAVTALTNQTYIRATFYPPFLLLHSDEDPLEPLAKVEDAATAENIRQTKFIPRANFNDRDWDFLLPILTKTCAAEFLPKLHTGDSFHFYRHSFAAWNLSGWEAMEVVSLAGKETFTVKKKLVVFEGDERVRTRPRI